MIAVELFVVLLFIFLGARIGGIGIGFAGGAGVIALSLILGVPTSQSFIPIDVILIIMSVITAIAAMQVAGGMDWLVQIAENFLRKHPERITFYAPIVTFLMTLMAGTGHTAFSTLPVIAEVAKGQGVRPSRPLSIAVVASQIAITASPISAAVVAFAAMLAPFGVDYLTLLMVCIPTTFIACMVGAVVANYMGSELKDDPVYQERLEKGLIKLATEEKREILPTAKKATYIFLAAIGFVVCYAAAISSSVGLIENPALGRNEAIMSVMLAAAAAIVLFTKIDAAKISSAPTFRSGMTACVCVLGVAWLGSTFVNAHVAEIKDVAGALLSDYPWMLALVLFFASMLLYSQGATTVALMPAALAIGVAPLTAVASFAAVSALFVLPTYPTLLAAVEMDDTGSTRIGNLVFNHPFFIPGVVTIATAVALGFGFGGLFI
ncbi:anaerobic C4-dicarboxylate transporter [Vibrio fortis]|jgi:anaerobic C4-dicarboxylate transporter DcuA|uniref:C4-dicarboxylate transporter n=2 Tax=Vibrio TaxID=662 RepID=A0A5N3S8D4_9VIBR|nr:MULTISPECIES: anaerobic C4-dicarboxylate transporter [Vibrio]KAB0290851.1 anaerobic C4-dicarboxylate transporter [Vibrio fortis]KAB0302502.1 anaerobic C4-dicarboxylate transporter [Vibrio fortis]MCG9632242.1 anaerobic C4-dicarboxylate transporter [Vibrio sp. Isolate30]MDK9762736.1 anaerobic C4-dicarboxylate transporter [Vibrio sp. D420a]QFT11056.1 Anaerobic C4-dicarboxylate transporter DcuA [Vibrio sp. THAF190c]|tara:strand:+ start:2166 stop:3473 length:1308 start_codon:yes stop_codon:yes gene_type:complete